MRKLKLYFLAFLLGGIVANNIPVNVPVEATQTKTTVDVLITPSPILISSPTPTKVPEYDLDTILNYYNAEGLQREYGEYIWNKWKEHGNRLQAVALCTNIAEGHLDDNATGYNEDSNSTDRGCWQWNDLYNPGVSDEQARNCKTATDLAYDKWNARGQSFQGYWYGYGSNNYNLCMSL